MLWFLPLKFSRDPCFDCFGAAMVEALTSKATAWEKERGIEFSYDGVSILDLFVFWKSSNMLD